MNENGKMCDVCGIRPATIYYKQTINGMSTEKHLCAECARKYQISGAPIWNPVEFFNDFLPEKKQASRRICKCGTTEEEILKSGKFGCSECYKTFSDLADRYIHAMGGVKHNGKRPGAVPAGEPKVEDKKESEIEKLKRKLSAAIEEEDFLLAADIKKKIDAVGTEEKK